MKIKRIIGILKLEADNALYDDASGMLKHREDLKPADRTIYDAHREAAKLLEEALEKGAISDGGN